LQKPAFLIPLPAGQKNEQLKNAMFVKNLGLGEFIEQYLLTPDLFVSTIFSMLNNIDNYKSEKRIIEDAAEKIVGVLKDAAEKKA
jgi:UDP-N-acetylglucosamine:LPS N-acetylglucosamine transferase